ncbi:MAG TPA: ABC transporter ATP-binding protein [Candidatus Syntrophoarchaeum butanivorans]|uniref:ABC transporter ATP-binding protein n=1 Tax=Candidatus Syntropharchaeum butanivorans TaxID=1839936 RepID=A0A1F2P644_9EURY|nr:MAG: branched-chain amino acid ABC transporter ATP-binding protein [Candidatus Syntrophoarchaeum butanivorans]HEC57659.1 ABC transporter ATP-binding protein [Candidatus Syntrophoarchaeum butanivorans]
MRPARYAGNELLKVDKVSKQFEGVRALDEVTLSLKRGDITLLIGPNGSGKSTLIGVITGFHRADSGRVLFRGEDITALPPHAIYGLGIARTFQIPRPLKRLTLLENLMIARATPGEGILRGFMGGWFEKEGEIAERAFKLLEFLNLEHLWDHPASDLSGGQLKLLEVGRALMSGVELLIMDEPFAGVAPGLSGRLLDRLRELKRLGLTILLIEHRLDLVVSYVDRVYVLADGKVIAEGSAGDVLKNPDVAEVYLGA